ncbi:hypothetical protein ACFX19_041683 [Malus domestica]
MHMETNGTNDGSADKADDRLTNGPAAYGLHDDGRTKTTIYTDKQDDGLLIEIAASRQHNGTCPCERGLFPIAGGSAAADASLRWVSCY